MGCSSPALSCFQPLLLESGEIFVPFFLFMSTNPIFFPRS